MQREGGMPNPLSGHFDSEQTLHKIAVQIDYCTDGFKTRIVRVGNVTSIIYLDNAFRTVYLWAEKANGDRL
jgi:hypothetical protein